MRGLSILAGLGVFAAVPAQAQPALEEIYRLTEKGAWPEGSIDQTLSFMAPWESFHPKRWIVERVRTDSKSCGARSPEGYCRTTDVRIHDWIDSDTCPALIPALIQLGEIRIPPFAGADRIGSFWASHLTMLTIEGRPRYEKDGGNDPRMPATTMARVSIREQTGFFHSWWDKAEAAIEPCWRVGAPSVAGKRIEATLRQAD